MQAWESCFQQLDPRTVAKDECERAVSAANGDVAGDGDHEGLCALTLRSAALKKARDEQDAAYRKAHSVVVTLVDGECNELRYAADKAIHGGGYGRVELVLRIAAPWVQILRALIQGTSELRGAVYRRGENAQAGVHQQPLATGASAGQVRNRTDDRCCVR